MSSLCAFSCTGLGLVGAALGLRVRETAVLSNVIFGVLLVFSGVNVPLDDLPGWMAAVSPWLSNFEWESRRRATLEMA